MPSWVTLAPSACSWASSDYGTGLSKALNAQLTADGATVTHDGINPTKNYTAEATKIIGDKPDAVYYSGYYSEFGPLAKALNAGGYKGPLLSGDGSNDDQFIKDAGGAASPTVPTSPAPAVTPTATPRLPPSSRPTRH